MKIHERIRDAVDAYEISTGKEPTRVYLGRNEMKEIILWAYNNQYVGYLDPKIEGDHRPEVCGIPCWKVNEDNHLVVCGV